MNRRNKLRIIFLTLFVLVCFLQCFSIVKSYLEYPTIINTLDESPNLISILPAITICNNNRVSLRQLIKNNATFRHTMERRFRGNQLQNGKIVTLVDQTKFDAFRDQLFRLYSQLNFKPDKMALNLTLDESFDYKPEFGSFIEWFVCARTARRSMDCANMTRIESVNLRKCTTLLHQGAMLYDGSNRPELFSPKPRTRASMKDYFDSKEVAKLVLNFEPEDYGDLSRQIGGRITFHDSSFIAGVGDFDYFVTRGFRYDFSIDRLDTKLLGRPYSDCLDYQKRNLHKYRTQVEPRIPLNAHTCIQNCLVKNVLSRSNCWPATQPYFRNDSFDPDLKLKFCPWFRPSHSEYFRELLRTKMVRAQTRPTGGVNETNQTSRWKHHMPRHELERLFEEAQAAGNVPNATRSALSREYRKINRFCLSRCALPCRIVEYSVTVTKSVWPSDVKTLFDKSGEMRYKRHCCALIVLKYAHFHYNIHEYQPKYDLTNVVGDLGGLLAFWLGLSIISIYHAIQKLVGLCSRRSLNKIRDLKGLARRGGITG